MAQACQKGQQKGCQGSAGQKDRRTAAGVHRRLQAIARRHMAALQELCRRHTFAAFRLYFPDA